MHLRVEMQIFSHRTSLSKSFVDHGESSDEGTLGEVEVTTSSIEPTDGAHRSEQRSVELLFVGFPSDRCLSFLPRIETGNLSDEIRPRAAPYVQRSSVPLVLLSDDGSESGG